MKPITLEPPITKHDTTMHNFTITFKSGDKLEIEAADVSDAAILGLARRIDEGKSQPIQSINMNLKSGRIPVRVPDWVRELS